MSSRVERASETATAAARRRMLVFARLAERLAAGSGSPDLGEHLMASLSDEVEAFAFYRVQNEGGLVLLLHAGAAEAPPAHARSAVEICGRDSAELVVQDQSTPFLRLGTERAAWIGPRAQALAAVAAGGPDRGDPHGLVFFVLKDGHHAASLAALLELVADTTLEALLREPVVKGEPAGHAGGDTRVLLIDDEDLLVAHVKRILERAGFAFYAAHSARAGFELAKSIRPDVLLIDKVLPDLDGIRLLHLMRRDESLSTVPVIMLSGHADETARVAALGEGADDFVVKPFSAKDLVARIHANVRLVRLRRAAVWRQGEVLRLRQSQHELRKLLDTVQRVRDDERRMLAREVHDQLGQILTAAKIDIRLLQIQLADPGQCPSPAEIAVELGLALSGIDQAIVAVQDITALLRPPGLEEGGLVAALCWQAKELQRRTGIKCVVRHEPTGYVEQPPFVAGELLRMCQEALTNVLRHAVATRVVVQVVMRNGGLLVRICDNGVGIARGKLQEPASFGLTGMRERAASIQAGIRIYGRPGRGTMVAIRRRLEFV